MKATTIIIAAVFSLQFNALSADNPENKVVYESTAAKISSINLAPVTPPEADFSDVVPELVLTYGKLAPVTPSVADFNDNISDMKLIPIDLAPETPADADFEEIIANQPEASLLIPVTPAEADFD